MSSHRLLLHHSSLIAIASAIVPRRGDGGEWLIAAFVYLNIVVECVIVMASPPWSSIAFKVAVAAVVVASRQGKSTSVPVDVTESESEK